MGRKKREGVEMRDSILLYMTTEQKEWLKGEKERTLESMTTILRKLIQEKIDAQRV